MSIQKRFGTFSRASSKAVGSPYAFALALACVVTWALLGPMAHFSQTWQLVINTGTTIVTFLMVFLIQSSQNRDAEALQLKLDELIFALNTADDEMIDIERLDQASLDALQKRYRAVISKARRKQGRPDDPADESATTGPSGKGGEARPVAPATSGTLTARNPGTGAPSED